MRNEVEEEVLSSGSRGTKANTLFRAFFQNPILELTNKSQLDGIPNRTLRRLVDEYTEKGFLVELSGKLRDRTFVFKRYLDLFKTETK